MKKKLIAFLVWIVGASVCFAQSGINNVSPSIVSPDGSRSQNTTLYQLPQVQPTLIYNASATPTPMNPQPTQVSNWQSLNGQVGIQVDFAANSISANYGIQMSNNPTPFPSQTPSIYTVVQDHPTLASGGQGYQVKNWSYYIKNGWKYWRAFVIPDQTNGGFLGISARQYGNDITHPLQEGVPWQQSDPVAGAVSQAAATLWYDYKLPTTAHGLLLYNNVSAVSGACTLLQSVSLKDPVSGQLQAIIGQSAAISATGVANAMIGPGIALPTPAATPPAGMSYFTVPVGQDVVIKNAFTGTGNMTYSTTCQPLN